jgi:predicted transport protein
MSNDVQKAIEKQLKNIEASTGKSIAEWKHIIKNSGLEKHGELVNMLKTHFGLGHGNANTLVHTAHQSHADVPGNETDWLKEQYKGKENLRPLYEAIVAKLQTFGNDVELSPKKTYMSLRRKKQFAIIQPSTKTRLDLGLNIKGLNPSEMLEAAGSWNSMCTHRIKLDDNSNIDDSLVDWMKQAYDQAG